MPPTLWEQIVDADKNANTKLCPDCQGAGKIQLFSSWEDPCKTCKGKGFLSKKSTIPSETITYLQKWVKDMGYPSGDVHRFPTDQGITSSILDSAFVGLEGHDVLRLYVSDSTHSEVEALLNLSADECKYGTLQFERNGQQAYVMPLDEVPDRCLVCITGKPPYAFQCASLVPNPIIPNVIIWGTNEVFF